MRGYCYNTDGVFLYACDCHMDPVRTRREGHPCYALPAMATTQPPPDFDPEGQRAVWDGAAWRVEDLPPAPTPQTAPEAEPSELERLRADLDYLAVMTGVRL